MKFFVLLVIFSISLSAWAQQDKKKADKGQRQENFYNPGYLRFTDYVYAENITSVLLHRLGWELSPPIILYGTEERLVLSFDDLNRDYTSWQYTVVHCDADWNPTDLWKNEYIVGFTDAYIQEYKYSYNTLQPFINYSLILPNRDLSFTLSGNYILMVYPDGEADKPIITRRFMVVEPGVTVRGEVKQATPIDLRFTHHEVRFSLFTTNYYIAEPYRDLKVVLRQNGRWDNAIWNLKPLMLRGDELDYQYTDGSNVFEAGNEFRYFDTKSMRYQSERVINLENRTDGFHVELMPDKSRATSPYITYGDINGMRTIETEDADDATIEAEYVWVDFFLPYPEQITGGGVYIMGALTDWQFGAPGNSPASAVGHGRMEYNFARQGYEARLYLKQGYFNYQYAFLPDGATRAETAMLEGNRYETKNTYTVLVYHRQPGSRYDRLIAAQVIGVA
ncbi:MAG: DUF5103 domain-containing protein [Bacteroidales bacterium]|nr:DUF5103 domain-containing protein [Bacteroidales bacterium]